jgi:hypothetical protein
MVKYHIKHIFIQLTSTKNKIKNQNELLSIVFQPNANTLKPSTRVFITWGRHGFDVGSETLSACRGTDYLVNTAVKLLVANDDNYALAA